MSSRAEPSLGSQIVASQFTPPVITKPSYCLYMGGIAAFKDEEVEDIIRSSVLPKKQFTMPSISNNAQAAKDLLETDAYDIELIRDLGFIYASEVQWDRAANVMMRGWKRASELKEPNEIFKFLMKLSEVSFRNRQNRQAHAIYMDIEEPQDYNDKKAYQLLGCHVFSEIGDAPKALSIFSKAIEGEDFETSIKIWAACALRLKKVGAFEAAKNAVNNKARTGQNYHMDQSRMQTVESWSLMSSSSADKKSWITLEDGVQPWMKKAFVAFWMVLIIYFLYCMEARSLKKLKITA